MLLAFSLCFWAVAHFYGGRPLDVGQSNAPQGDPGVANAGPLFDGDMYATMPQIETPHPTYAEDMGRAQSAKTWVRVIFEKESQPQFAELVKSALEKQWKPDLGYQLVFGESQGPIEEAATAVTYRMAVRTHSQQYQTTEEPNKRMLFSSVDLKVSSRVNAGNQNLAPSFPDGMNRNPVPTSWDHLEFACEDPLPQSFKFHTGQLETINRRQLGILYQDFGRKLAEIPAFCFFPDRDFDYIRDLYAWPTPGEAYNPSVDPLEFAQITKALVSNYDQRPINRVYLDAICTHMVAVGATNYVAGISTVLCEWLPHLSEDRRQLLASNLPFANYELMKTLLSHRQGYLLFRTIPEVWNDPGLADFSRDYWRKNWDSPQLAWMAREFADKLKSAPVYRNSRTVAGQSKPEPVIIILPPRPASAPSNHMASTRTVPARTPAPN